MLRGDPLSLGAQWDGEGINFALFSAAAERVELSLFEMGLKLRGLICQDMKIRSGMDIFQNLN